MILQQDSVLEGSFERDSVIRRVVSTYSLANGERMVEFEEGVGGNRDPFSVAGRARRPAAFLDRSEGLNMIETTLHFIAAALTLFVLARAWKMRRERRRKEAKWSDDLASDIVALMGVEPKLWGVGYWEGGVHLIHIPSNLIIRIDGRPRVVQPFHREFEPADRARIEAAIAFSFSMMTEPKEGVA